MSHQSLTHNDAVQMLQYRPGGEKRQAVFPTLRTLTSLLNLTFNTFYNTAWELPPANQFLSNYI